MKIQGKIKAKIKPYSIRNKFAQNCQNEKVPKFPDYDRLPHRPPNTKHRRLPDQHCTRILHKTRADVFGPLANHITYLGSKHLSYLAMHRCRTNGKRRKRGWRGLFAVGAWENQNLDSDWSAVFFLSLPFRIYQETDPPQPYQWGAARNSLISKCALLGDWPIVIINTSNQLFKHMDRLAFLPRLPIFTKTCRLLFLAPRRPAPAVTP